MLNTEMTLGSAPLLRQHGQVFRKFLIAALLALVGSSLAVPGDVAAASTQTRYVDPGGSDAAAGSAENPWRTLQHAVDSVDPGATIVVNPGSYAGMRIERSGAPGAWIRLVAAEPGTAAITGPGPNNRHDSSVEIETWDGNGTVSYWVIAGFDVSFAPNWGIDVRGNAENHSHHIIVRDNYLEGNGIDSIKSGIFFAFTDHVWVMRNESIYNGEHGIYLSNSGDHFVVRDNSLAQNQRCGLHMNGDLSQGGDGKISHGLVDGNEIDANGAQGCAGINMDGVTDTVVSNNLITANRGSGITLFKQDGAVCSRRNQIINNTVLQADDGRWGLVVGGTGCRDNLVRNNIFLTEHAFRGAIEMPTATIPGFDSDYNIVADRFTTDDGDSIGNLADWQAATGQDAHSIVATIGDMAFDQFSRPQPGGVAEDAGVMVATDHSLHGVARPSGAGFDIGAHESPYCEGLRATVLGTRAAESLSGTAGDDVIVGLGGNDYLEGSGGNDTICGGDGRDRLRGGAGSDLIRGGRGSDLIIGGPGDDWLYGNRGNDTLEGRGGDDYIRGGSGEDAADGGPRQDDCRAETRVNCE
ncbi:MAG: NosD domain-containing protein [Acidimicrobiia bacterium]